jgi:CBS domain-containing protein
MVAIRVSDIMSEPVACCAPVATLQEVARLMVENDCGEIPICNASRHPIGVITDRDITTRTVAEGRNPVPMHVRDVMTTPIVTVNPETSLEECSQVLERNRIRRVPVVDASGRLCGMVSQADIARHGSKVMAGTVVQRVSEPNLPAAPMSSPMPGTVVVR